MSTVFFGSYIIKLRNTGQRVLIKEVTDIEGRKFDYRIFKLFVSICKRIFRMYKNLPKIEELVYTCPHCRVIKTEGVEYVEKCFLHSILDELHKWCISRRRHDAIINFTVNCIFENNIVKKVNHLNIRHDLITKLKKGTEKVYTFKILYINDKVYIELVKDHVLSVPIMDDLHKRIISSMYIKLLRIYDKNLWEQL